jgi:hypothetical protein
MRTSYTPHGHTLRGSHGASLAYNPHRYVGRHDNPMSRNQKIILGVGAGVVVLTVGAILFWPSSAKAAPLVAAPKPGPTPAPTPRKTRPAGDPPNPAGGEYDVAFWDAGGVTAARQRIFDAFTQLGYAVPTDRATMNDPGPDAVLGGDDDVPNASVREFQANYNSVSAKKLMSGNMGGLDTDGLVGPKTLNGLKFVIDSLSSPANFDADEQLEGEWQGLVAQAQ